MTNERPRVLHLLPVDLARGAQTYAKAIRDTLDSPDVEHRTATIFGSDPAALDTDFDLGVPAGWDREAGLSFRALATLRSFLRRWRPDIVIAHGGEALKYAALVAPRQTRLVYYKIGTSAELRSHPIRRTFHRLLGRRADIIAGVSREMLSEAIELLAVDPSVTTYLPNARDPAKYPRADVRGDDGPVRFISVGHLTPAKRPQWFVRAIGELRNRGIECRGRWIGDGPLLDHFLSEADDWVQFAGRDDDVASLLGDSDVFLMTSVAEGMPGVLIEAGLVGLPSVATAAAGVADVVKDGVTGFVVGASDWVGFLGAAEELARDAALRERMGKAAHEHCLEHFTVEMSATLWRRELQELLRPSRT